jgi:hypothetical protein
VFGRESLKEFIHGEGESLREFIRTEQKKTWEFIRSEQEKTWEFIRGEQEKTWEFIRGEQEKTREFEREILLRNEKVYTSVIADMERLGKEMEEGRRQIRANTEAVLRLLDRFDQPGDAAA